MRGFVFHPPLGGPAQAWLWDMRCGAADAVAGKTTRLWRLSTLWKVAVQWRWRGFAVLLFIFFLLSVRQSSS